MVCKNNNCKAELPDDAVFCLKCGTKQEIPHIETSQVETEYNKSSSNTEKKTKTIAIILVLLIATIGILGVIYSISKNDSFYPKETAATTITTDPQPIYNYNSLERCPVKVKEIYTIEPNSAGGIDLVVYWETISQREIKYIYLYATPYNRVGDIEASEIGGKTTVRCRMVGPYKNNDGGRAEFENVWYNNAISDTKIDKIEIEYMDGETIVYEGENWIYP